MLQINRKSQKVCVLLLFIARQASVRLQTLVAGAPLVCH